MTKKKKLEIILIVIISIIACWCIVEVDILNTYHEPTRYTAWNTNFTFVPESEKVNNIRFSMAQIPKDGSGSIEVIVKNDDFTLFRGTKNCEELKAGEWIDFNVNLSLDTAKSYKILINIINTEFTSKTLPLISIGYADNLKTIDKFLVTLFILVVYIASIFIVYNLKSIVLIIKKFYEVVCADYHRPRLLSILSLLVFIFGIELSNLAIDSSIKILLALIVFITTYWCENHMEMIREMLSDKKNAAVVFALSVWTAFSLVGSRYFIYPVSMNLKLGALALFIATVLLMVPLVLCVILLLNEYCHKFELKKDKKHSLDIVVFSLVVITIGALFYIRAFNPAITSGDTNHCMYYALKPINGISDWHPAFYILWLKAIIRFFPNAVAVVVVQYIFFAYVLIKGILFLYERGIKKGILYGIVLFSVLNCANMVHFTTIWKDIPYTLSIVWLNLILAILLFGKRKRRFLIYIELVVSLVCTCFFRQAGIVPFIITCIALLFLLRKNWKVWISVAMAVCIALTIKIPVYNYYEIQKDHGGGVYIGLGQDILGAYYNGGELSEEAINIVNVLSKTDISNYPFSPYRAESSYDLDMTKGEFIRAYLDTFFRNPILVMRSFACRMDAAWDIFVGEDGVIGAVNYLGTMDGISLPRDDREFSDRKDTEVFWDDLWGKRENNFLTERMTEWTNYSINSPTLNLVEWTSGIWFWLFMVSIGLCIYKKRFKDSILIFVPCLSHVLSLMLSTGWSDFRYYWPINLMAVFVVFTMMTLKEK